MDAIQQLLIVTKPQRFVIIVKMDILEQNVKMNVQKGVVMKQKFNVIKNQVNVQNVNPDYMEFYVIPLAPMVVLILPMLFVNNSLVNVLIVSQCFMAIFVI